MGSIKVRLFDRYVLKPLWLIYVIISVRYFVKGSYGIGIFMLFLLFIISIIGQALHPQMTSSEMARGTSPKQEEIDSDPEPNEINDFEVVLISRPSIRTSLLIGFTSIVLLIHHGFKWYLSVIMGGTIFIMSYMIIPLYSRLMISRRIKKSI